jgi:DNA polymerase-1
MLCYHASFPYLKKALETLTSIYTYEPYYKDDGKVWDGRRISDEAEFIYNGRDCCVTREIWPQVERDARELVTWKGYQRTISVIPSLLGMQIRGVRINVEEKENLQTVFKEKTLEAERILVEATGQTWNLNSSPQMIRLLYGYLGLPMQYNHKTKKPTTDKDALNRLRKNNPENRILKAVVDHRKFAKLSSTYADMKVEKDNRIRTSYGFVSTYRLSSSESIFGGGGNLQNIPVRSEEGRLIRKLFIPDEGKVLLASDLSQAEARVVAWLSNDTRLIEAFQAGEDVHWLNAQMIFQIPDNREYIAKEKWRDSFTGFEHPFKFYRDLAKTIVYAASYGMGHIMLQTILIREEVYLKADLCKRLLYQYKANNPMLKSWQNATIEEIRATRTLISPSPFSRKRVFRGRLTDNLFRSALAFRPQSVVGEILEVAIEDLHEHSNVFEPLLNVHDEVVGQCLPENLDLAKREVKGAMEIPLQINDRELIIPCDFKTGPNWGSLKAIN